MTLPYHVNDFYDLISSILQTKITASLPLMSQGGDFLNAVRVLSESNKRWNHTLTLEKILNQKYTIEKISAFFDIRTLNSVEEDLMVFLISYLVI
ncbi:hypothetical protein AB834_07555 [PVC group bacterium (ex Bugula neritina AB1)]|nr:hypothetical protein AB834_07555 [PVC group bacterium (ex Bugula neritina AB1)]